MPLRTGAFSRAARMVQAGVQATGRLALSGTEGAAAELVTAMGELRGLAAKVGQMASYVEGIAPHDPAVERVLATLRAATLTSDPTAIRAVVEAELGPLADAFATWSDAPFASASLGQVHAATLPDGAEVAVKVQHPGIDLAVASDLHGADRVASLAGVVMRGVPIDALLAEVRARLMDELDYRKEAAAQEQYREAFPTGDVSIPRVHLSRSGVRVLTTDRVAGVSVEEAALLAPAVRARAAVATLRLFLGGALRTGVLHGDPHPGNLLYQPDGRLIALDFGCVQPLDPDALRHLRALLQGGLRGDPRPAVHDLLGAGGVADALAEVWARALAPLGAPTFHVTRPMAARVGEAMQAAKLQSLSLRARVTPPPWFILAHRTVLGLVSVLARLDVDAPYQAAIQAELDRAEPASRAAPGST